MSEQRKLRRERRERCSTSSWVNESVEYKRTQERKERCHFKAIPREAVVNMVTEWMSISLLLKMYKKIADHTRLSAHSCFISDIHYVRFHESFLENQIITDLEHQFKLSLG
jgi:hypothetical protein